MGLRNIVRSVTAGQALGIVAFSLSLFFMISFAAESVEAYRLRQWRDQLTAELAQMERDRLALQEELARRQSPAWKAEALIGAGWLPPNEVRVAYATEAAASVASAASEPQPQTSSAEGGVLFDNPNWSAWRQLLRGFDVPLNP